MSKPSGPKARCKNRNNLKNSRRNVLAIKLKRTDTTLDLSQKAKRAKEQERGQEESVLIYFSMPRTLMDHVIG
jgi:hypothetical protein